MGIPTSQYGACANCFRVLFVVLNIIFVILGLGVAGIGSYLLYLGEENDYDVITGNNILSGAALLVTAGGITLIISVLGIIGAIFLWRPILIIYAIVVLLLVGIEIAAGIVGFVFRNEVTDELEGRMVEALEDYRASSLEEGYQEEVNDVVSYVQTTFECCGVNSSLDWYVLNPNVFLTENRPPQECNCDVAEDSNCEEVMFTFPHPESGIPMTAEYEAWDRGCLTLVEENLDRLAISVGVIGLIVGAVEFFGVMVAIGLVVCIFKANKDSYV